MPEARRSERARTILGVKIVFNNRMSVMDCWSRIFLHLAPSSFYLIRRRVPNEFELYIPKRRCFYRARLIRHDSEGIGVEFCRANSKMAPKRICVSSKPNMPKYTNLPQSLQLAALYGTQAVGFPQWCALPLRAQGRSAGHGRVSEWVSNRSRSVASNACRNTCQRGSAPYNSSSGDFTFRKATSFELPDTLPRRERRKVVALLRAARRTCRCVYCRARREEMQTERGRTQRLRAQLEHDLEAKGETK